MIDFFFKGGPIMWPLLACSLIAATVIIERAVFWLLVDIRRNGALAEEVLDICRSGDWEAVRRKTAGSRNRIVKVLVSGIVHRDFSMSKAMEAAAMEEVKQMRRFMGVMDSMVTVSPLLGILGTVTGIIDAFEMLGSATLTDPTVVTAGIAQALITTATGLGIAIPTVLAYNFFTTKVENAVLAIENHATRLEVVYEKFCQQNRNGCREDA